jgi:xanthine dehydrogenase accessory factor
MHSFDVLAEAGELTRRGQPFALATVVWRQGPSSGQQGSRAIITAEGELHGWIGGACAEPVVIREARQVITEGVPRLLLLGTPDQFGAAVPDGMTVVPIACQSEGALEVYIEPVLPAPHLVVVGRSPMVATLAELARVLGWRTTVLDHGEFSAADADESSMVVVATQGHGDEDAVEQAAAAQPAYLGLVGSAKRGAAVLGYLADRGVPQDQLGRVRVPAGLDLGRTSHREIAVAILAELVQLRASGALAAGAAAGAGRAVGTAPAETVDLPAGTRRPDVLLLLRRLPPVVPGEPGGAGEGEPMLITNDFEVAQPVEKVWKFFEDIPQVATCLPGAELTEDLGGEKYKGRVAIRMGPVRLQFGGTAEIAERDEAAKRVIVNAAGAEEKGRGQASMVITATLARSSRGTKVNVAQDLQLSGAAAQYGRGMISDVSSVLMRDFATTMQDRIERIERGESAEQIAAAGSSPASGLALGLRAAVMALRRVFRRFFVPYQAAS